ncbi:MAG: zinc metallopeptidase [Puniceicoccales bacterium]|nr:zinc metallopeptidase [Puniceicoccales bacterium]
MNFWDYLIGGPLCTDYASDAIEILKKIGDAKEVTDSAMVERVYSNPLAIEILKRKGIELRGAPGIYCRILVFFSGVGRGLRCLLMSPLAIVAGIYAHFKLVGIHYNLADIGNPKAKAGDDTVYDIMNKANLRNGPIFQKTGKRVCIIAGKTNDLSACYYDSLHHVVSIPACIGKTVARQNDTPCETVPGKDFGAATALAIAFHEMGHAEQRKFLIFIFFATPIAGIAALTFGLLALIFATSTILAVIAIALVGIAILFAVTEPIIQFFYERDASVRSIANLIANGHITTEKTAKEAVFALQLAASTYLLNTIKSLSERLSYVFALLSGMQHKTASTIAPVPL